MKVTINALFIVLFAIVFNASPFASAESLRASRALPEDATPVSEEEGNRELQVAVGADIYEDWDYQGDRLPLSPGALSFHQLLGTHLGNDRASSFRVYQGFTLLACVNDFQYCFSYKHDVPRLYALNDLFSSFVVIEDFKH